MENFDENTLKTLTKLARIRCSDELFDKLLSNLTDILSYIDQLKEVDTENVPACNTVLEELTNVMREDEAEKDLERETFLNNTSSHLGGMIRVPPVIKF